METTQLRPSRDTIVSGVPATSTPIATGNNTHNSADFRAFLDHFDGLPTYQTFDDKKQNKGLARIIHNATPEQLRDLNEQGAGVFVMINEGDGQGRERKNVVRVRGFFADFDGAPLPERWPLEPSIITETSPGRYHAYWLLAEGQTAPLDNDAFNAQQEAIALHTGAQPNDCKGLNRVMRVPGFLHQKDPENPFLSHTINISGLRYDLSDITAAYPVQAPAAPQPRLPLVSPDNRKHDDTRTARQAAQRKYALTAMQEECAALASTAKGNRNTALNGTAYRVGRLVGGGHIDMDEARATLLDAAHACGLRDHEITATLDSGFYAGIGNPEHLDHVGTRAGQRTSSSAPVARQVIVEHLDEGQKVQGTYTMPPMPEGVQEGTDVANAIVLAANNLQDTMRYTPGLEWCLYQNKRGVWETSANQSTCVAAAGRVLRGAVAAHLERLINENAHKEDIERTFRWSKQVCNVQNVANALKAAAGMEEFFTPAAIWDAQPHLLNCTNGTLNLKTGVLQPHAASDYLTWQAGASYRPEITHPKVDQLLALLKADGRDEFLQRSVGSALYGENINETLTVLEGEGGTGKGTLCSAVMAMLGDYAHTIEISLLLAVQHGEISTGPKPELLALRGKRLVVAGEPPKGARFNAGRVKSLTGNDEISARKMHSNDMVRFTPVFKLWLQTNYPITVAHDDTGMQRRLQIVPFTQKPQKADAKFKKTLQNNADALSALLNWAYAGYVAWRDSEFDLTVSQAVQQATRGYWAAQDTYAQFAEECLIIDKNVEIPSAVLKNLFEDWAEEQGLKLGREVKMADLYAYLSKQGCEAVKGAKGARKWIGVTRVID